MALDPGALAAVVTGIFEEAMLHVLTVGEAGPTVEVVDRFLAGLRPGAQSGITAIRKQECEVVASVARPRARVSATASAAHVGGR